MGLLVIKQRRQQSGETVQFMDLDNEGKYKPGIKEVKIFNPNHIEVKMLTPQNLTIFYLHFYQSKIQ